MFGLSAWNELVILKDQINTYLKQFWLDPLTSGEDCYINIEYNMDRRVSYTVSGVPFEEMPHIEVDGISLLPDEWVHILTLLLG